MTKNLRISLLLIALAIVPVVLIGVLGGDDGSERVSAGSGSLSGEGSRVVRPDSQRLSVAEDGNVTFVEFLDFECEACRAAFPAVEDLRERYDGRVTFVVRNFPLHRNSVAAAKAAEAAAAQGKFEEMYKKLFETQAQWGEKSSSQEEVFFGFAEELGLDMDEFRKVYEDPATEALVERDRADGQALGVSGTPTFFLNGDKLDVGSFDEVIEQIDAALDE